MSIATMLVGIGMGYWGILLNETATIRNGGINSKLLEGCIASCPSYYSYVDMVLQAEETNLRLESYMRLDKIIKHCEIDIPASSFQTKMIVLSAQTQ
jgi:hypothetical protein